MPDRTLFEKIWDAHVVRETPGESALLYIDLHLVHEVTSPQAFDGLGWGIGTREVEHVLATQTLPQRRPRPMEVRVDGDLPLGVTAKDIVLNIIGRIGIGGGIGHVIEYTGSAIRALSMEGRMTVCNMRIER